ncbi:MAG: hypothetical protein JNG89_16715 [Planctomycetaceae bacterium]|nr:hypothetical protein [Planctomycetaceae bacterium]
MSTAIPTPPAADDKTVERVVLVSFPKIVFLWPSYVAALIAALYMSLSGEVPQVDVAETMPTQAIMGWMFLIVLSINLVVLSFDFPRATSLVIFFVLATIALALWLVAVKFPTFMPILGRWITSIQPEANATFYWFFFAVLSIIYLAVIFETRFDYWEVRGNELLHHHGMLSNMERFPAPQLKIDKEINDIFEFLLLGSGRLILHPSNERRAIVLENVLWINGKEKQITDMLGTLQVEVRTDRPS